jgi:hypothetical protein
MHGELLLLAVRSFNAILWIRETLSGRRAERDAPGEMIIIIMLPAPCLFAATWHVFFHIGTKGNKFCHSKFAHTQNIMKKVEISQINADEINVRFPVLQKMAEKLSALILLPNLHYLEVIGIKLKYDFL